MQDIVFEQGSLKTAYLIDKVDFWNPLKNKKAAKAGWLSQVQPLYIFFFRMTSLL